MIENPRCDICKSTENDPRKCAIMTRVPFSAPDAEQTRICSACLYIWYEYGAQTDKEILEIRRLPTEDKLVKSLA